LARALWPADAEACFIGSSDWPSRTADVDFEEGGDRLESGEPERTTQRRAQNSLQQSKRVLKKALGPEAVCVKDGYGTIEFASNGIECDVVAFGRAVHRGDRGDISSLQAVVAYGLDTPSNELLRGWQDTWVLDARKRRLDIWLNCLWKLVQHERTARNYRAAAELLRRYTAKKPEIVAAWQDQMEAWVNAGESVLAANVYVEYRSRLKPLGLAPPSIMKQWFDEITRQTREINCPEFEQPGGAMAPSNQYYVARPAVGKTSLLVRGIRQVREAKRRVVVTDLQSIDSSEFATPDRLYQALALTCSEQLELDSDPRSIWDTSRPPGMNLQRYVRKEILMPSEQPLVWFLDEVDRLFQCPFKNDVFALFRSWHNARSHDPYWSRLTLTIAYATEPHLFITDLNQSPFNVGTRLTLRDFSREQVVELNERHRSPLSRDTDLDRFMRLVGGHPYLVRCGFYVMAAHDLSITKIESEALSEQSIFSDHLARLLAAVRHDTELEGAVRRMLKDGECASDAMFYRLRSGGLILGDSPAAYRFRCGLYERFLKAHLT
jgi:DNA-binding SARP family transcriptional activator